MAEVSVASTWKEEKGKFVHPYMFDDNTETAPLSYGNGVDNRTLWIRKIFNKNFMPG